MKRHSVLFHLGLILTALFSIRTMPVHGQEASPEAALASEAVSSYRVDAEGKILQRISWSRTNAYFYEVEMERQTGTGEWAAELKRRTEELFVEVSLPPGMYRYRVVSYNVLGRAAAASEWTGIRVFIAKVPHVESTSPAAYYFDNASKEFVLVLNGSDLVGEAAVYLVSGRKEGERRDETAARIVPLEVLYSEDEQIIMVTLRTADFGLGPYDITVVNPGGLQTVYRGFEAAFIKSWDLNVSLGYAPAIPLYGYIFDTFSDSLYPAHFYGRVSIVPVKRRQGFFGVEVSPAFGMMKTAGDGYTVNGMMTSLALDALYQYWFGSRVLAVNVRLGAGLIMISGIKYEHPGGVSSEEMGITQGLIHGEVSFEWIVWRNLFTEAGLEYAQLLSSRSPAPGMLRFTVGAGWRF